MTERMGVLVGIGKCSVAMGVGGVSYWHDADGDAVCCA